MPASDSCGRQTAKVRDGIAAGCRSYGCQVRDEPFSRAWRTPTGGSCNDVLRSMQAVSPVRETHTKNHAPIDAN
jgi:hypothetical protein